MLFFSLMVFSFGLAGAAPQGVRTDGKDSEEQLTIRLVLRVQKTDNGTKLVVQFEESPEPEVASSPAPPAPKFSAKSTDLSIASLNFGNKSSPIAKVLPKAYGNHENVKQIVTTAKPALKKLTTRIPQVAAKNQTKVTMRKVIITSPVREHTVKVFSKESEPQMYHQQPKLEFKISLGNGTKGSQQNLKIFTRLPVISKPISSHTEENTTTEKLKEGIKTTTKIPEMTTIVAGRPTNSLPMTEKFSDSMNSEQEDLENETLEVLDGTIWDVKAVADQGFGVLASRCASFGPGLVSDGAGGCTKPINRQKKKASPTYTFRSAAGNELHADVKNIPTDEQYHFGSSVV